MNRATGTFALFVLAASGLAAAQSAPPPSANPSSQYPSSTMPQPPAETPTEAQPAPQQSSHDASSTSSTSPRAEKRAQMKDCMEQQHAANSGMSKRDIKKLCKSQMEGSSPQG